MFALQAVHDVDRMAGNANDTKHYFTIMPIVSEDGGLMLRLYFQIAQP